MSQLHFPAEKILDWVSPERLSLQYTSVRRLELRNTRETVKTEGDEMCAVVLSGTVSYSLADGNGVAGLWDILYIPRSAVCILESEDAVVMLYRAPADQDTRFRHLPFDEIDADPDKHRVYGTIENNTRRHVWHAIDDDFESRRFLVGFCRGAPGGWTAWPPHEHTLRREEVYVYSGITTGFGVQLLYDDLSAPHAALIVRNGDLVTIPRGYHPNIGSPGGGISYVYVMTSLEAGDRHFRDLTVQQEFIDVL